MWGNEPERKLQASYRQGGIGHEQRFSDSAIREVNDVGIHANFSPFSLFNLKAGRFFHVCLSAVLCASHYVRQWWNLEKIISRSSEDKLMLVRFKSSELRLEWLRTITLNGHCYQLSGTFHITRRKLMVIDVLRKQQSEKVQRKFIEL